MNDKLMFPLLIALVLCAAFLECAIWSMQTGIPVADIILFRG